MFRYLLAGQEITFSCPFLSLEPFLPTSTKEQTAQGNVHSAVKLIRKAYGWVAGADRQVEVWSAGPGWLLQVSGSRAFYIPPDGSAILPDGGKLELNALEREVAIGLALVLALALHGKWCLHASAARYKGQGFAFVGESGFGKSMLAASLAASEGLAWQIIADDILPVTLGEINVTGWPHFPQLKLPAEAQPGLYLPDQVALQRVYLLAPTAYDHPVTVEKVSENEGVRVLLSHTAGARLFDAALLARHLAFCAQAARKVEFYKLSYPHRRDILETVQHLLEQ